MKITRRVGFESLVRTRKEYKHMGGYTDKQYFVSHASRTIVTSRYRTWTTWRGVKRVLMHATHRMVSRGTFLWTYKTYNYEQPDEVEG